MANTVDPDETAVSSGFTLFAEVYVQVFRIEKAKYAMF